MNNEEKKRLDEVEAQLTRTTEALRTFIAWVSQSATGALTIDEAQDLMEIIKGRKVL